MSEKQVGVARGSRRSAGTTAAGAALGIGLTCPSPELAQICAHAGFDVVMIDMEHGPISIETAYRMVTAIEAAGVEPWIRVPWNDAAAIKLALDTGARHVVVPMITTRAEAEQAVASAKYPPRGIRGWGPFRTQFQWRTDMLDYSRRADAETGVSVLIEHPSAVDNIDEILSVEGLDGAIAAPLDLAANMGHAGDPGHPQVQAAVGHVRRRIAARGLPVVAFSVTPEHGRMALEQGATMLFLGFDTMFLPNALQAYVSSLASRPSGAPSSEGRSTQS